MSAKYDSRDEQDIERRVAEGCIASSEFLRRVAPIRCAELFLESPELIKIIHWCFDYFKEYGRAPRRDIASIYMRELQAGKLEKSEAEYIERILSRISDEYERGEEINVDYLFDRAVDYFNRRAFTHAAEEAVDAVDRGDDMSRALIGIAKAIRPVVKTDPPEPIDEFREAAAEAVEAAASGDMSRARIAAWRAASVGSPIDRLPDPFGDPEPPSFDLSMLPAVLRRFAQRQAQSIGVEASSVAWAAIAACSGALDGSLRLQMKRLDPGFTVPVGIWLLLVGDPSSRKSPVLKVAFDPIRHLQSEKHKEWVEAKRDWDREDEGTRGPEPRHVQFITHDPTPEGLRDLLAMQDRGITALNDEWARFIGAMGRYSGGRDAGAADRAFFNTAFDGGEFSANRAGRKGGEHIYVANLQISVVGGVQPDVLRQFNQNRALLADGLLQRSIPILMGKPRLGEAVGTRPAVREYERLIQRLAAVPGDRILQLTEAAEAVRMHVEERLFQVEAMKSFGPGFSTAVGKLHGIWGRLAAVLAFVAADGDITEIDAEAAELARRLVLDSVLPNLALFYQMLGGGGEDVATTQAIAAFVLREQRGRITASDVIQHVGALHRRKADQVRDAVSPLVTMEWLTPEGTDERRARAWEVNPAVYTQFAERAAEARAQAAAARTFMSFIARANANCGESPDPEEKGDSARARNKEHQGGDGAPSQTDRPSPDTSGARNKTHKTGRTELKFRDKVRATARRDDLERA